jgi:hypothetical protein
MSGRQQQEWRPWPWLADSILRARMMRRSMIEVYRLSGTKIHHPISDLDLLFLPSFPYLKIASSSQAEKK